MNKSEIIAAAKIAEDRLEAGSSWDYDHVYNATNALQSAARLLEKVEVLDEGSEPQVGDLVEVLGRTHNFGTVIKTYGAESNNEGSFIIECWEGERSSNNAFHLKQIIQRNSRPVITIKKGEV